MEGSVLISGGMEVVLCLSHSVQLGRHFSLPDCLLLSLAHTV